MALTKQWQKPSKSGAYGDNSPEARLNDTGEVELRESDQPHIVVTFTPTRWEVLGEGFKSGEFALPAVA